MKKIAFLFAAASTFTVLPLTLPDSAGAIVLALTLVALSVGLATAASESWNALAVGAGAMGALFSGVLGVVSPAVGGAALVGLAFAERTMRVRGSTARVVHLGGAIVGGAIAGAIAHAYLPAAFVVRAVAVVVSAVVVALPLLVDADDPVAHALDQASRDVTGDAQASLREGAELRRSADDVVLTRADAKRVRRTWSSLLRLAEARVRLERAAARTKVGSAGAVVEMVNQRIADHVRVLTRAYTAVDAAHAAAAGLDDADLKSVEVVGESLEEESRALVEVRS